MAMIATAIRATIRPYSTAVAPFSSRLEIMRFRKFSRSCMVLMPFCTGRDRPRRVGESDRGGDLGEQAAELAAQGGDHGDDRDRDQGDHQAVLDGGGALLVALGEHEVQE